MHSSAIMIRKVGPPCKLFSLIIYPRSTNAPRKRVNRPAGGGDQWGGRGYANFVPVRMRPAPKGGAGRPGAWLHVHYVRKRPAQKRWSRPAGWAEIIGGGSGHANFVTRDWL